MWIRLAVQGLGCEPRSQEEFLSDSCCGDGSIREDDESMGNEVPPSDGYSISGYVVRF